MLKKFQINITKNAHFFLLRAPTHHSFTFNLRFLYELKHKLRLSKTVCRIFHFRVSFIFIKVYIVVPKKCMDSFILKRHNSFQNENNRKATHIFAPRPPIFKLHQQASKFNDIFVS